MIKHAIVYTHGKEIEVPCDQYKVLNNIVIFYVMEKKKDDIYLISFVEHYSGYPYTNITEEEFNKIKEWYENE